MHPSEIKEIKDRERKYREKDVPFGVWTVRTKTRWWNKIELENVLKTLRVRDGENVLDVGCSDGRFLEYLHGRFPACKLFGIDFARNPLIELLKKPFSSQAVCGEVTDMPFKDGSFDRAVTLQVIQHLPSHEERIKGLKSIYSSLFFSEFPPPTERTKTPSPELSLLPLSHSTKIDSHPLSFVRAVNSETLSVGA